MLITITLNPALDWTIAPDGERMDAGGKGFNVSKTLHALGIPSIAAVWLAGAHGEQWRRLAEHAQVPLHCIPISGQTRVNRKLFDGRQVTEVHEPGAPYSEAGAAALLDWLRETVQPDDTLVLCGSLPPGAPEDCYARIRAAFARERVIVDTSGAALRAAAAAHPDAIKPNLEELEALCGHALPDTDTRIQACRALPVETVLLSLGAEGAMLSTPHGVWTANAPEVPIGGTVGAGDAMTAVLAAYRELTGADLLRACVAAGSASVMQPGTAPMNKADWERLMPLVSVTQIR